MTVVEHVYEDENGAVESVVVRVERDNGTKSISQKRPDPNQAGKWIRNTDGCRVIPYKLPRLIEAIASEQTIYIVEGEKCADVLWQIGIPATTNAGGACKWKAELNPHFKDADVVLVPDHDDAGFKHINQVGEIADRHRQAYPGAGPPRLAAQGRRR
jgi:hypothetical protein